MPENLKSTNDSTKIIILGYFSVTLMAVGLVLYYVNWWMLYLSVLGVVLNLLSTAKLDRKADPKNKFHSRNIFLAGMIVFVFLFIIPVFLGVLK